MTFAHPLKPMPRPDVEAYCLDCSWSTAAYLSVRSYDKFLTEVGWHEGIYGHIVHIYD